ncbi:Ribosomal lysine N-methyltransferase 4 [Emydomyces testavorans]|uniref:Ribosomal lysine N-methyltransferase 4 n=1 Tax=Emydomyces testavorans TaxID=2070801 RepID=A0AAF0DPA2_9EURO|nr:Ribosomal lysine N-methyltransferase 4 [Emydomyces testavorans]
MDLAADDDFAQRSDAFMNWLKQHPGVRVSSKIKIADLRPNGAGRGVVACEEIAQDEELFAIPEHLVLSVQNSNLRDHINFADKGLDTWLSLIITMIYEYLRGRASRWSHYFDILPTDFDTLMFWTEDELRELQGSSVLGKIGKQQANEVITKNVFPLVVKHQDLFPSINGLPSFDSANGKEVVLELAHRMGTLIMAYAFDIEMDQDDEENDGEDGYVTDDEQQIAKGMVPLADLLNADAHRNNACLFQEDRHFIMRSIAPISNGEEIFNDYGELPRADLLRRYGYITENYAPYDVVEVSLQTICKTAGVQENCPQLEFLEDAAILEDGYAFVRPDDKTPVTDAIPSELLILLQTIKMSTEQVDQMRRTGKLPKPELDEPGAKLLVEIVQNRQHEYLTTISQDDELLKALVTESSVRNRRLEMAIRVRKGEKEVLQLLLGALHTYLSGAAKEFGQPLKRTTNDASRERKKQKTR